MPSRRDLKTGRFVLQGAAYIDEKGYPRMSAGPLRGVRIHRIIAAAKLGRPLTKDEDVHHLDGNRLNFAPENIRVMGHKHHGCVSAKQHFTLEQKDIHLKGEWDQFWEQERAEMGGQMSHSREANA